MLPTMESCELAEWIVSKKVCRKRWADGLRLQIYVGFNWDGASNFGRFFLEIGVPIFFQHSLGVPFHQFLECQTPSPEGRNIGSTVPSVYPASKVDMSRNHMRTWFFITPVTKKIVGFWSNHKLLMSWKMDLSNKSIFEPVSFECVALF